jgi:Protein of unknown function (DUF2695)
MLDKSEKERGKQIIYALKNLADQKFESSLPICRNNFKKMFDHLDRHLNEKGYGDITSLTKTFLLQSNIEKTEEILEWLAEYGGYCDCEILANVKEQF